MERRRVPEPFQPKLQIRRIASGHFAQWELFLKLLLCILRGSQKFPHEPGVFDRERLKHRWILLVRYRRAGAPVRSLLGTRDSGTLDSDAAARACHLDKRHFSQSPAPPKSGPFSGRDAAIRPAGVGVPALG